jgi:exopolyphosphatase/pppGpp-phosphohydrolase
MQPIAAIDIGTNSIHLLIATIDANGKIKELVTEKKMVRLGAKSNGMTKLDEDAIKRGIKALTEFKSIADNLNALVVATATSAVREAKNGNDFVKKVFKKCGIEIRVIDGIEEAELIYKGVTNYFPIFDSNTIILDIGGGSTETIVGNSGKLLYAESVKLGTIRLTEEFLSDDEFSEKMKTKCRNKIHEVWKSTFENISNYEVKHIVGTSGTIRTIARAGLLLPENSPRNLQLNDISIHEINHIIQSIKNSANKREIREIAGIEDDRADIILAGALILEYALNAINPEKILLSSYALREGIIVSQF